MSIQNLELWMCPNVQPCVGSEGRSDATIAPVWTTNRCRGSRLPFDGFPRPPIRRSCGLAAYCRKWSLHVNKGVVKQRTLDRTICVCAAAAIMRTSRGLQQFSAENLGALKLHLCASLAACLCRFLQS